VTITVDESRVNAQTISGLQINSVTALKWVADAIKDICAHHAEAGTRTEDEAVIDSAPADHTLKKTLVKLSQVEDAAQGLPLSEYGGRYVLNNDNTITFRNPGTYRIKYLALPDMPSNPSSEIPLPPLYVSCIEYYLAHRIRARLFGQADGNAVTFFQQYEASRDNSELARLRRRQKRRMPPGRR